VDRAKDRPPLTAALLAAQDPDGGWGAEPGRHSNTEATALAVLALAKTSNPSEALALRRGLDWLVGHQRPDGGWPLGVGHDQSTWPTPLAVLALLGRPQLRERATGGLRWLVGHGGIDPGWLIRALHRLWPAALPVRMDPTLKGWSWNPEAFSWVEPTAYALLALKKGRAVLSGPHVDARIREGESMLFDRVCEGGGWNYGNTNVYGVSVPPYPEVTAIALVGLQDRRDTPAHWASSEAMRRMLVEVDSGFALSWTIAYLAVHGQDAAAERGRLAASYARTGFLGSTRTLALALIASGAPEAVFGL
jgi:Prenyltransferase and squalene oxidase repeat